MTNEQLIEALKKLDPKAPVFINIMQYNKVHGVIQLPISTTKEVHGYEFWVAGNYQGATITVHLPKGAYLSKLTQPN